MNRATLGSSFSLLNLPSETPFSHVEVTAATTGESSGWIVTENLAVPVSALTLSWPVFISFSYRSPPQHWCLINSTIYFLFVISMHQQSYLQGNCSRRGSGFSSSNHVGLLKTTVTPATGNSVPLSGLHGLLLTCGAHRHTGQCT